MKKQDYVPLIKQALKEDVGRGDITTNALVSPSHQSKAYFVIRQNAVMCGLPLAKEVFRQLHKTVKFTAKMKEGQCVKKGSIVAIVQGPTRAILTGERVALNFLGRLSGIATLTHHYVQAIKPYKVDILDTRKTTPLLRILERYAVKCGGGVNHRFNLNDMVMIKDNHRAAYKEGSLAQSIQAVRRKTRKKIQVEVDTLAELKDALLGKPDMILLDNMSPQHLKKVVYLMKSLKGKKPLLEASGGIHLRNIKAIAKTGVDRISIGALTHSANCVDIGLDYDD